MVSPPETWRVRIRTYVNGSLTGTEWSPTQASGIYIAFHPAQGRMVALGASYDIDGYSLTSLDSNSIDYEKGVTEKRLALVTI